MTTKTDDIKLPPLPEHMQDVAAWLEAHNDAEIARDILNYARAAVEANRQGRVPSDEEILALAECASVWVPMGSGPEKERSLQALRSLITTALSRYSSGQPAASAEPSGYAYRYLDGIRFNDGREVNGCKPTEALPYWFGAAPVAQEPVAWVSKTIAYSKYISDARYRKLRPAAQRWYEPYKCASCAAHVAAQEQTDHDEDAYVIASMGRLLAEIAVIVRGAEQPPHRHGYADLPARVAALKAESVAAQAQPTMPALTDAMRAVLRTEHDVYLTEDALYAALCDAAGAQPSGNSGELPSAQDLEDASKPLIDALEESNSLLVACMHEKRPLEELEAQIVENRDAIDAARAAKEE